MNKEDIYKLIDGDILDCWDIPIEPRWLNMVEDCYISFYEHTMTKKENINAALKKALDVSFKNRSMTISYEKINEYADEMYMYMIMSKKYNSFIQKLESMGF